MEISGLAIVESHAVEKLSEFMSPLQKPAFIYPLLGKGIGFNLVVQL
jgi:hypothetical protein